ncbi:MAG: M3 family metallopeptidase [Deltaproteobacteria bacterium]|nr:M3 family metallopeptidase [Deltaproteobacteria bacterium]
MTRATLPATLATAALMACSTPPPPPEAPPPAAPPAPAAPAPTVAAVAPYEVLLAEWQGPNGGVPPWDKVKVELFVPAIEEASKRMLAEVEAIATSSEPPTFENTLAALERAGKPLDRSATLFFVYTGNMNDPAVQAATGVIRPRLAQVQDQVNFNTQLFERVKAVYDARETSGLDAEQKRVVEKSYDAFVQRGASLPPEKKARMGEINQALAKLFTDFGNRVLADEDTWVVLGKDDLGGLPEALVGGYAAAAKERKVEGWAVVNTRSAVDPFLTFSNRRDLREKVWNAFIKRGDNRDDHDTNALITEIVKLRAERAQLLGYASHAHWRMADTMAKDPKKAMELMMRVWPAAVRRVKQEVADMSRLAKKDKLKGAIQPWDYRYYMEKVRQQKYALDQTEFKNYFELNNMIQASYFMAGKLYGYAFEEVTGQFPVFHPDVRVFHVTNASDGSHVGYLYRDDFARQYKRSGAWQATYQGQSKFDGQVDAIVSNNNNFTKGAEGEPVLISLDDAETLFHEFGHALHALTNDTTYPSLGGTPRDFVEFPSQVHENWVLTREVLDKYARHYKTGEAMPQALIDKMRAAATFNQGFSTVEYLAAAIVDMKLHTDPKGEVDPVAFEQKTLKEIGMPKEIVLRHRLPQFMHLFTSDAYSAGYYSYLWSDVMAADAWQAFEETGDPWNPEVAKKFKEIILATGDAIDRAEAYRQFRGRDPKVEALLQNRGLK